MSQLTALPANHPKNAGMERPSHLSYSSNTFFIVSFFFISICIQRLLLDGAIAHICYFR